MGICVISVFCFKNLYMGEFKVILLIKLTTYFLIDFNPVRILAFFQNFDSRAKLSRSLLKDFCVSLRSKITDAYTFCKF